jgi:hypothetical protein
LTFQETLENCTEIGAEKHGRAERFVREGTGTVKIAASDAVDESFYVR